MVCSNLNYLRSELEVNNQTQMNTKSIISLTLGILSLFIPFIGMILGVIGIVMYKKASNEMTHTQQDGKGLAVSGLICSIVGIFIQILPIIGLISFLSALTL